MRFSSYFIKQALGQAYKLPLFELGRRFDPLLSLIPFKPVEARINVTDNCNARCITCSSWREKSSDEMTTEEIHKALAQLKNLGTSYLFLSGGEPLLRRDLESIVQKARELDFERIQISTNGLLLDKKRAQALIESGATTFYISLNGLGEVQDLTRGVKGCYEKCLEALKALVELRDTHYPDLEIKIATIVMQPTVAEIPKLFELCRELKIELTLCPLDTESFTLSPNSQDITAIDKDKLDRVIDELHHALRKYPKLIGDTHTSLEYARNHIRDPKREDIPCYLGYLAIYIGAHGEVLSGCNILPPLGNIRKTPLKQITTSNNYRQRLRDMFYKKCPGCTCGHRLNLYAHLPAVLEEILWYLGMRKEKGLR